MKKLLYILFFFVSCNVYGQVTITHKVTAGPVSTNATSYSTASHSYTSGRMYVLTVMLTGATTEGEVTASSQTWTVAGSTGDATRRIVTLTTVATSTVTETLTYGNFGSTATGFCMTVFEVTGFSSSVGAVRQVHYGGATGANPTINMGSLDANSAVFTAWMSGTNPFGGTPEAGWTEHTDGGYTVPDAGVYFMYRNTTSDNTPTVTAASSTWIGLGIEIAANRRRISIIN